MVAFPKIGAVVAFLALSPAASLAPSNLPTPTNDVVSSPTFGRRSFFQTGAVSVVTTLTAGLVAPTQAFADIPMISTKEFSLILKDSAQAVQVVEFSGPKSETVIVRLVDGTSFGINDVIESSVDPRSPLKIAAMCRENRVPTKFTMLEAALKNAPKKKVVYANERVREAAEKEKEKQARIQQDEEARLAELYRMQEAEAAATSSSTKSES